MESIYLSITAISLTVIGLLFQHFAVLSKIKERLTALETKMDLFWKAIEGNIVKMLKTFPTNINKDILLDKLSQKELDIMEAEKLRTILIGEMETTKTNNKLAYVLVIARLEQLLWDIRNNNKNHKKSLWRRFLSY